MNNNINNFLNNFNQDIDELFNTFIENVNSLPLYELDENYEYENNENDIGFMLNQNIINNAYTLRRSLDLRNPLNLNPILNTRQNEDFVSESFNYLDTLLNTQISNSPETIMSSLFNNFNTFMDEQLRVEEELQDVKVTLTNEQFSKLNSTILDKSVLKNQQCSICLEDLTLTNSLIILQCTHIYHKNCLKQWVTNNSTKCCVCRFDIRNESS
jgi:hypothetical protein